MSERVAILIVNGFDRVGYWGTQFDEEEAIRYPWIEICLREVERRSRATDHEIFVWDNSQLPALRNVVRAHGARLLPTDDDVRRLADGLPAGVARSLSVLHSTALQNLWSEVGDEFEYVLTLDTDAFPIRDGWLEQLKANLTGTSLTGVWRDEMSVMLAPFVHPSCLFIRRARLGQMERPFSFAGVQDVGQRITHEVLDAGERIMPLRRSNARNAHFLIGGLYGDLVYHHAAGSRRPVFRLTEGQGRDDVVYSTLRDAVFKDADRVVSVLRGEVDDDLGLEWEQVEPTMRLQWSGRGPRDAEAGEIVGRP